MFWYSYHIDDIKRLTYRGSYFELWDMRLIVSYRVLFNDQNKTIRE